MSRTTRSLVAASLMALMAVAGCSSAKPEAKSDASSAPAAAPAPLEKLRIAYQPDLHGAGMVVVGQEKGFWKEAGLDVTAEKFTTGLPEVEAMAAGKIDIGYLGPGGTWMPASGRCTIVAVDSLNTGDYVIANPKSGIKDLKDLKGKKVGVPQGTSGDMILQLALKKAGLTVNDIQYTNMDTSAVVTAFVGGQIDVAAIWSPLTEEIKKRVPDALFLADDTNFMPEYSFPQYWCAAPDLVKNKPDLVVKFIKGFIKSSDYRMAHTDEAIKLTAKFVESPEDGLKSQNTSTKWMTSADILKANNDGSAGKWFEGLESMLVGFGKIPAVVPAKDFMNTELFAKAMGK